MPERLLRLLALLQGRREWSGPDLADRLGVTTRTVRRDIDRLRALDYPVTGTTGHTGGYRLRSGNHLPPLALDDDEAIAVAAGLVSAAGNTITGIDESAAAALAKLQQTLPKRLRPRLAAFADTTTAVVRDEPRVDPTVLAALASGCRDSEILSFDYRDRNGEATARRVEPHNLVTHHGHWYLIAYDPNRADWRTFRADRIDAVSPTHRTFDPRQLPAPDAATHLTRSLAQATYRHTARITVALTPEALRARLCTSIPGDIDDHGTSCTVRLSAESADLVVHYIAAIAALDTRFTLDTSPELTDRVRALGHALGRI